MNYPLTRLDEKKERRFNRLTAKRESNLIKLKNERDNKVDRFCDYTSHNLKEFIESSNFQFVNKIVFKKDLNKNYSRKHEIEKVRIASILYLEGKDVILEPTLKDKSIGRPDVLVLSEIPAIAYEIVCSEKEYSLIKKDLKYPFKIKVVRI